MHYYKFNIGDYQSHTSHLSPIEDIAYRRLLDWLYLHEKPLPNDLDQIARLIRMRSDLDSIKAVLDEFFTSNQHGIYHKRVSEEVKTFKEKSTKAKRAAKTRWASDSKGSSDDANAMRTHSERNANHKPLTTNQEPLNNTLSSKPDSEVVEGIFRYWLETMGKQKAALSPKRTKAIQARLKDGYSVDEIKQAIYNCSRTPHNMGQNRNGKRYDDIELICRSPEKLESFRDNEANANAAHKSGYATYSDRFEAECEQVARDEQRDSQTGQEVIFKH